jgi:hypothetical protein
MLLFLIDRGFHLGPSSLLGTLTLHLPHPGTSAGGTAASGLRVGACAALSVETGPSSDLCTSLSLRWARRKGQNATIAAAIPSQHYRGVEEPKAAGILSEHRQCLADERNHDARREKHQCSLPRLTSMSPQQHGSVSLRRSSGRVVHCRGGCTSFREARIGGGRLRRCVVLVAVAHRS